MPRNSHATSFVSYTSTANPLSFEVDTFEIHNKGYGDKTYLINGPVNVEAVFVPTENFQLTTYLAGYGSIVRSIGGPEGYPPGTEVTLTALPSPGTYFSHWGGDLDGLDDKANPITVVMDRHKTIGAHFESNNYVLTVISNPAWGGSVEFNPPGGTYPYRSEITLTPTANEGFQFAGWDGVRHYDYINGDSVTVRMELDRELTANFSGSGVTRTVTFDSQGGTAVDSQTVLHGSLAARPADPAKEGFDFAGWFTGTTYGTQWNFSTDPVTADMTLFARWTEVADTTAPIVTLDAVPTPTTEAAPTFTGTAGILAGDLATVTVNIYSGPDASGTPVQTLTTTRDGSTGAYAVTAAALADGTYTARAEQSDSAGNTGYSEARTFVVATVSDYTLTVATNPAGIVPTTGSGQYGSGETVTISAPDILEYAAGSRVVFTGWTGDGVVFADPLSPSTTLIMPAGAATVTANYRTQYYLTVDNGIRGQCGILFRASGFLCRQVRAGQHLRQHGHHHRRRHSDHYGLPGR